MSSKAVSCFLPRLRAQYYGYSSSSNFSKFTSTSGSAGYHFYYVSRGGEAQHFQISNRYFITHLNSHQQKSVKSKALAETSQDTGSAVSTSLKEKVKENAKTGAYGTIVLLGIAVTGAMFYLIMSELFSSDSPNSIYTKSFKLCKSNQDVQNALGEPLKCYGEETRRGWRRHVAHQKFLVGDTKYIRMKFYMEGKFNKGTVHLEKKTNAEGNFEYSYLVVDVDTYPPRRINVADF